MVEKSSWTKTTCAYCGVGCGVEAKVNAQGLLDIRGDKDHPANYGKLCSKGLALGETVSHEGRLLHPSIDGQQTDWPTALDHVATQFTNIIEEHGPNAVAFYASGQLLTEDYYLANKLMKGFIGSGNIDTNSRLCMSSAVVGHKRAFGTDTVPVCYEDLDEADMVVITGSNLAWCHPVLFQRIKAAKALRPEMFVVVIDPRATDCCAIADLHLAIQPGSDVALFNGLLQYLSEHDQLDQHYIDNYTEGFSNALSKAKQDSADTQQLLDKLAITDKQLAIFYQRFAATEKVLTLFSQGVNQSTQGSDKVNSILNCHLATGRIGKPGSGPFSVTGQPNAMGGREVGGLANTLAAHMEFGNPKEHDLISNFWQTENLATGPGLKAVDMFDALASGEVKAIWIMATNPVVSLPNSSKVLEALQNCPLVVVSDCIQNTATTKLGNVLLPAQGWSEKSGTVTNSERRISRQRRLLPTPGQGKPDWWIISEVAKRMGFQDAFNYVHEGEVFAEHAKLTTLGNQDGRARDLNLIGLTDLDTEGYGNLKPQQWPVTQLQEETVHQRMFADKHFFTPSNKAQFIAVSHELPKGRCSEQYPLLLNSGRIRDHWHTMTRTGLSSRLSAHINEPFVTLHSSQAARQQLSKGDLVQVNSAQGSALVRLSIDDTVTEKQAFMPIHWNSATAKQGAVCALIPAFSDQVSGQPEFKATPINISKWSYQSEALLLTRQPVDVSRFAYWVKQKIDNGYLYRIADTMSTQDLQQQLDEMVNDQQGKNLYHSTTVGLHRYANIQQQQMRNAYIVDVNLQQKQLDWMQQVFSQPVDAAVELAIISGEVTGTLAAGKIICACKQVGENTLIEAIQTQRCGTAAEVGQCTQAGTGCGSCIPDIEQLIATTEVLEPIAIQVA